MSVCVCCLCPGHTNGWVDGKGSKRPDVGEGYARTNTINPTTVAWTASEGGFCSRTIRERERDQK